MITLKQNELEELKKSLDKKREDIGKTNLSEDEREKQQKAIDDLLKLLEGLNNTGSEVYQKYVKEDDEDGNPTLNMIGEVELYKLDLLVGNQSIYNEILNKDNSENNESFKNIVELERDLEKNTITISEKNEQAQQIARNLYLSIKQLEEWQKTKENTNENDKLDLKKTINTLKTAYEKFAKDPEAYVKIFDISTELLTAVKAHVKQNKTETSEEVKKQSKRVKQHIENPKKGNLKKNRSNHNKNNKKKYTKDSKYEYINTAIKKTLDQQNDKIKQLEEKLKNSDIPDNELEAKIKNALISNNNKKKLDKIVKSMNWWYDTDKNIENNINESGILNGNNWLSKEEITRVIKAYENGTAEGIIAHSKLVDQILKPDISAEILEQLTPEDFEKIINNTMGRESFTTQDGNELWFKPTTWNKAVYYVMSLIAAVALVGGISLAVMNTGWLATVGLALLVTGAAFAFNIGCLHSTYQLNEISQLHEASDHKGRMKILSGMLRDLYASTQNLNVSKEELETQRRHFFTTFLVAKINDPSISLENVINHNGVIVYNPSDNSEHNNKPPLIGPNDMADILGVKEEDVDKTIDKLNNDKSINYAAIMMYKIKAKADAKYKDAGLEYDSDNNVFMKVGKEGEKGQELRSQELAKIIIEKQLPITNEAYKALDKADYESIENTSNEYYLASSKITHARTKTIEDLTKEREQNTQNKNNGLNNN